MDRVQLPTFTFPLGAVSPLWGLYAGAAMAGSAWWWMSRWSKPTNLEALAALPVEAAETMAEIAETVEVAVVEAVAEIEAPVIPEPAASLPLPEAEPEPVLAAADDLTRIVGIGPKLSAALVERGLKTFADIAALDDQALDSLDRDLDLKGRAVRDAWVAQAVRFSQAH